MKNRNIKFIIVGVGALLWAGAFIALAQTRTPAETVQDLRERAQTIREETKAKAEANREEARAAVQNARKEIELKRQELKQNLLEKRKEAKARLEAAREEAKGLMEARREEVRARIEQISDERKRQAAARLDEQINRLNERWTTHFSNYLDRLEDILGKIELRAEKAASLGKNITAAISAVQEARGAVSSARTAVEEQAKKVYTAPFSSEDGLRTAFRDTKNQLHDDLTGLRDGAVKSARDVVHRTLQALSGIPNVDEEPEEEESASAEDAPSEE